MNSKPWPGVTHVQIRPDDCRSDWHNPIRIAELIRNAPRDQDRWLVRPVTIPGDPGAAILDYHVVYLYSLSEMVRMGMVDGINPVAPTPAETVWDPVAESAKVAEDLLSKSPPVVAVCPAGRLQVVVGSTQAPRLRPADRHRLAIMCRDQGITPVKTSGGFWNLLSCRLEDMAPQIAMVVDRQPGVAPGLVNVGTDESPFWIWRKGS